LLYVRDDPAPPGLTRVVHRVDTVALGRQTRYNAGVLTVSTDELERLAADSALDEIRVSWASPGEPVRIVKVLDAVEPRTKGPAGGGIFPGVLGLPKPQGHGATHVLRGVTVVAAGFLPRAQEAVADLSGPAAALSPLGRTHNLVVEFSPAAGARWEAVEAALRRALCRLAAQLASAALDAPPDAVEKLPGPARRARTGLARVAAITNIQTQGSFKDTFVYGRSFGSSLPTLIDPNELEDGAVVSGQYGHPGLKNPTYLYQNHPVVAALRQRDGQDLRFGGLVLCPEPVEQDRKELVSEHAARLCAAAGFDAVVVTKEGGGNADADMALKMDALEALGIPAVGLFAEMAGADGTGPPVVVAPTRATAMASMGNYDQVVSLPAVERAVGGHRVDLADRPATAPLELPTAVLYCALSPLGWGRLTCREAS
jgi:sarcosine reductase